MKEPQDRCVKIFLESLKSEVTKTNYMRALGYFRDFAKIEVELVKLKSTGQTYRRYFNPVGRPSDALHSCNYNEIAHDISRNKDWHWVSG